MKVELEILLFLSFCLNVVDKQKKITFWQPLCIEGQRPGKELNTYKAQDQNFLREKNLQNLQQIL